MNNELGKEKDLRRAITYRIRLLRCVKIAADASMSSAFGHQRGRWGLANCLLLDFLAFSRVVG